MADWYVSLDSHVTTRLTAKDVPSHHKGEAMHVGLALDEEGTLRLTDLHGDVEVLGRHASLAVKFTHQPEGVEGKF